MKLIRAIRGAIEVIECLVWLAMGRDVQNSENTPPPLLPLLPLATLTAPPPPLPPTSSPPPTLATVGAFPE